APFPCLDARLLPFYRLRPVISCSVSARQARGHGPPEGLPQTPPHAELGVGACRLRCQVLLHPIARGGLLQNVFVDRLAHVMEECCVIHGGLPCARGELYPHEAITTPKEGGPQPQR